MSNSHTPTVVDLFCGAGGFSLGFAAAGFRIVLGVDHEPVAGETFKKNLGAIQPHEPPQVRAGRDGDLEDLDLQDLQCTAPDVLIGGPPCQGFSRVGRAKLNKLDPTGFHSDPRNELYLRFLEAAEVLQPRAVVMENVPGMLRVKETNVADVAAADLSELGYQVGYAVLNAAWYGVPQFRERFIMIGLRSDLGIRPSMPDATHVARLPTGYQRPTSPRHWHPSFDFVRCEELPVELELARLQAPTTHDALGDLPILTEHLGSSEGPPRGSFRRELKYHSEPHSDYAQLMRNWPGLKNPHVVVDHAIRRTPRDYETFARMNPGDRYPTAYAIAERRFHERYSNLESEGRAPLPGTPDFKELWDSIVPPYRSDLFVDKWKKLVPGEPSWTVPAHLAKDSYSHIHYDSSQGRAISVREAARLQSFPDAFVFEGNMGECLRQIGNAVPPLLARALALNLRMSLEGTGR